MSLPTVLMPTDVFPPKCGGAGWSAHALARALQQVGAAVTAIVPTLGVSGMTAEVVLGVPTRRYGYRVPNIPFIKNYARHERLWQPLSQAIIEVGRGMQTPLVIHAQHVQVTPAAVLAGAALSARVVVTVRDHWPWDYFATGLHGDQVPYQSRGALGLATDLVARLGPMAGVAALPAVPYMQAHMRRRQAFLAQADAVIAVSQYIAQRLEGIVPSDRIYVVPNMVDVAAIREVVVTPSAVVPQEPFLLFVGKLERNKGAHLLPALLQAAQLASSQPLPRLVVAGSGPLRDALSQELAQLGVAVSFLDWVSHDDVLRLMAQCQVLLFPSAWGEPLSRVLLEACACGAAIVAMPTGGTPSIITDRVNGALEPTPERCGQRVALLLSDPVERQRLAAGAVQYAYQTFAVERVIPQVLQVYQG